MTLSIDDARERLAAALTSGDRETVATTAQRLRDLCDAEGVLARHLRVDDLLDAILRSPLLMPVPSSEDLPLRCPHCGSVECEMVAWVTVNTPTYVDGDPPDDDVWCERCDLHLAYGDLVTTLPPSYDRDDESDHGDPL